MKIQKITDNEINDVVKIAADVLGQSEDFAREYITGTMKINNGIVLIAKENDETLGFIRGTFTEWNMIGNIGLIATAESARGKGVGKKLMTAFENWAREKGVRKIFVDTGEDNKIAQIFYIKCDYVPENYLKDYYNNNLAGINFGKKL